METFLKDNFISSDSFSPPSPWPRCYGLLALVQYHESLHSLTFGVLSINPTLSYHGPFALCELQSGLGLLYSFCLTAISDELDDALHVSSLTLRGTTWSEPSGICGISQRWRPCFPSLGTGHSNRFSTYQAILLLDSEMTAVSLHLQGLAMCFILTGEHALHPVSARLAWAM